MIDKSLIDAITSYSENMRHNVAFVLGAGEHVYAEAPRGPASGEMDARLRRVADARRARGVSDERDERQPAGNKTQTPGRTRHRWEPAWRWGLYIRARD